MIDIETQLHQEYPKLSTYPNIITKPTISLLQHLFHEQQVNSFLESNTYKGIDFVKSVLEHLNISYKSDNQELLNIPAIGKCIIVANHPLGAIDAFALIDMLVNIRQNRKIKIVANVLLNRLEPLDELIIPVDNMSGRLTKTSHKMIEEALINEEMIIFFPAGEVARANIKGVKDGSWKKGFLKYAVRTQAPVLPIFIEARNSLSFYTASMFYKPLGTILLAHEMIKSKNSVIEFVIGELVSSSNIFIHSGSLKEQAKRFRKHLYLIAKRKKGIYTTEQCISHPEPRQLIKQELKLAESLGKTTDNKIIYLVTYDKAPTLLNEIGRLREYSFRKVGEGSGKKRDLDMYDKHYRHLVLWDDQDLEVVGAYRLGECNWILSCMGKEGLYLNELCKMNDNHDKYLMEAVELGRSFIQPRYWGSRALDYLWQGIGAYLYHNPEVRYLTGPVSISASYPKNAQDALVYFYANYFSSKDQSLKARSQYKLSNNTREEFEALFDGLEYKLAFAKLKNYLSTFGVTVPTLYKQYAELCEEGGVSFLDFGVDHQFNDCVDGYILVDRRLMTSRKKSRYITRHASQER